MDPLKKPKEEPADGNGVAPDSGEQEEALLALAEHLKQRIADYKSKLAETETRLIDTQSRLSRLRNHSSVKVKLEARSPAPPHTNHASSKTQLIIPPPSVDSKPALKTTARISIGKAESDFRTPVRAPAPAKVEAISRTPGGAGASVRPCSSTQLETSADRKKRDRELSEVEAISRTPGSSGASVRPCPSTQLETSADRKKRDRESTEAQERKPKRKIVEKEHQDIIPHIRTATSPRLLNVQSGNLISSQHMRKLRGLALNPTREELFATSSLDGFVKLWQVQSKGGNATFLSSTDCATQKRRWPEDITWHPDGDSLFSVYTADGGEPQISILNLNSKDKFTFLKEKPHVKGIINSILFMPWDLCFATGGSDHAVILWTENNGSWKPKAAHRSEHTSSVMGVAGLQQKKVILSVGADKRIIGFDLTAGRSEFKHQIDSKCMSVLPNTSDFNLFMVQTGTPEKQLRLFDIRLRRYEIHSFGWKQESSESQSALINQAWSPDGYYISSGSADPKIHIFDIRYNASRPSQSVQAHHKRVFKAEWHQSFPLLISISSDLNIGLHKIY